MSRQKEAVLYLHGLGGSAQEAAHYRPLFPGADVTGLDYHGIAPWDAGREIGEAVLALSERYESVEVIGNSLGAFLAMHAGVGGRIRRAYFISPVVNMEQLILRRMAQDGVTEAALQKQGTAAGSSGWVYSWEYLCRVRALSDEWRVPTAILYGAHDELTPVETIRAFAQAHNASLTVMPGGEHWFHTEEQMRFLDEWLLKERRSK